MGDKGHKKAGLYIHVPFCASKCPYCDFYSVTELNLIPSYLEGIRLEAQLRNHQQFDFETIYIGGGSPSMLDPGQVSHIIDSLKAVFSLDVRESTIEANPGRLTSEYCRDLIKLGFNRMSIGFQSFRNDLLAYLGRKHTAGESYSAFRSARDAGFTNIGIDLLYGLPGQKLKDWVEDLHHAIDLNPEHISCYQLTLDEGSMLSRRNAASGVHLPGDDATCDFFIRTSELLEGAGYFQYEVSNYCRGMENMSRHNSKYWDHSPYLGLGPSAHSFDGRNRSWNHSSVGKYLESLAAGRLPVAGSEKLAPCELRFEEVFLGLRTKRGVPLENDQQDYIGEAFSELISEGLLIIEDGYLRPTRRGLALADRLAVHDPA